MNGPPPGGRLPRGWCHDELCRRERRFSDYEEHGSASRSILLHGGLAAVGMYAPILPMLAKDRRVIAVDLQAHGHTADVDRPLRFETRR